MILFALLTVDVLSKESLASTSVETYPGTISRIFAPNDTAMWSKARSIKSSL